MEPLDQVAFAKTVLSALSVMKADIYKLNQMLVELRSAQPILTLDEARQKWEKEANTLEQVFHDALLRSAGLRPDGGAGTIVLPPEGNN